VVYQRLSLPMKDDSELQSANVLLQGILASSNARGDSTHMSVVKVKLAGKIRTGDGGVKSRGSVETIHSYLEGIWAVSFVTVRSL
jgi:hypothetical protein